MTIFYKKGIELNGQNPTFLYGYGGFNVSITPGFAKSSLFFAEQGGVYVVANIRGGGEYGEAWHEAGTLMQKQMSLMILFQLRNILLIEIILIPKNWLCAADRNGGLLVGAVVNPTSRPI